MSIFSKLHRKVIRNQGSRDNVKWGFVLLALFLLISFMSQKATEALITNSTYGNRKVPIYSVDTEEKKISLSFDAAWGSEDFQNIMEVLEKHQIKVTFFMTGGWVEDNPDCVKYLVGKGHDLGNHSENHYDMTTLSQAEQIQEISKVHDKVKELTGYEMFLFRPPYGAYDNTVIDTVYSLDYYPIQWDVDKIDIKVMTF